MTKKNYERIAEAFQESKTQYEACGFSAEQAWLYTRSAIADVCELDNPRFDRERFLRACEPGANVRARG